MILKVPKPQAEEFLKSQIKKGKELQEEFKKCGSQDSLDKLRGRYYNWDHFNEDVLLKIFPNDKEKNEYQGSSLGVFLFGERSLQEKIQEDIEDIEKRITKLEGMMERLELYQDVEAEKKGTINYDLSNLHSKIIESSSRLFNDKHYAQAIFEAFKQINDYVKEKSGIQDRDGASLMEYVFSPNNPILAFNEFKTQSEKDEQLGFMLIFRGAMLGIRNPKAHEIIVQRDPIKTLEYLAFASLLIKMVEDARKI